MNAYRDELEAALQRNEQLERELAEAREASKRRQKPRRRKKKRGGDVNRWDLLAYGGLGLGGAATIYVLTVHILGVSVAGSVSSHGGELGDWTFEITDCRSGQDLSPPFDGVELSGQDPDAVLRVARQSGELWIMARSPRSSETAPGDRRDYVQIDVQLCDLREVEMTHSSFMGTSREGGPTIWNVDGHVRLDCSTPGSGQLVATAEFEACTF